MLQLRQPAFPWMVTSLIGAMVLHGCVWFFARLLAPQGADAVVETQRQIGLGFFWMVGALALWSLKVPKSRLKAVVMGLTCAGLIGLLGSALAFGQFLLHHKVPATSHNLIPFAGFSLLMVVAQLVLAIPAAITLQQIALKRTPPDTAVPHV
ncbi:hypothetical protein OVA03_15965 [Asticcacaulis sp. SL142]|uniref:hypothetical protein n=1 Tax=Asticcacaulis sp. SL142 TaxID=2995155 RepID=UPI00226C8B97|nr:hypothetical protein [Asticcacaulis sp. SL142]WAC48168.1 hypothetical protein OVA03_15965 [Asticcacaulis sp. SL142]